MVAMEVAVMLRNEFSKYWNPVLAPINVHENPIKTHEFGGVYFHLKGRPRWALQN